MPPGVPWDTPQRNSVIHFKIQNLSNKDVSEKTGVPSRTVSRIFNAFLEVAARTRHVQNHTGRPKKITPEMIKSVIPQLNCYCMRSLSWEELLEELGWEISSRTLQREMNRHGYFKHQASKKRYLTAEQQHKRANFAAEHQHWDLKKWKSVFFTDEVHFALNMTGTDWVIQTKGECYCVECIQFNFKKSPALFHCWAMVGFGYKSKLVFYDTAARGGNLTQEEYRDKILKEHVALEFKRLQQEGQYKILQEDGDGSHGTQSLCNPVREYKNDQGINHFMNWPPYSADLNIIENVWRILKQRVKRWKARTEEELKNAILVEWDTISQEEINKLVESVPQRIRKMYERQGNHTGH
ncbi:hypothetical protein L228DRAFT_250657 [Xylona heveae TC161]|uniref:Tc1-like transposase DDE domain-containing protein n=1 Tax=Xylona heveae (strain CBS 132557 / TC161) TaxID=1328760 RepID=A0A164ZW75_XYLHT|nr:hypothetical protein L228DRAFT_250657 [Xylona heveae TC161]KZF19611.1 hypothetical protein L228DRAFT_250657 [Xylona heveae TC161]